MYGTTLSQQDTCIEKSNLIKYAQKIYDLQTENSYLKDSKSIFKKNVIIKDSIIKIQRSMLDGKERQISLLNDQITYKGDIIKLQEEKIDELTPKWYDNKLLWFGSGFIIGIMVVL